MEMPDVLTVTKIRIPYLEDFAKDQLEFLNEFFGKYLLHPFKLIDLGVGIERDKMDGCNILLTCLPEEEPNLDDIFINHGDLH